jgi:HD-GYP domain-containing protein (c-di-GMP phosphodiesterase class II)
MQRRSITADAARVLIVPIEEAREGMALAAPVSHPEHPETDLLKSGYILDRKIIRRLMELGIATIYVDFPGLDELDRHLAPTLSPARQKIYGQIRQTILAGQKQTRPAVSYNDYYQAMRELVLTCFGQGEHPVYLEQMARSGGNQAVAHATAVAHLAVLLGIKLQAYLIEQRRRLTPRHAREVVNLGIAGMLHDMGKLKLDPRLQHHHMLDEPIESLDRDGYRHHARFGYEMIHNGVEASAAIAVLHHHQHFDGTGFPDVAYQHAPAAPLNGQAIHVFARILLAADLYDRLATTTGDGSRRSNQQVLRELRLRYEGWIDPVIHRAVELVCPPFPPGTIVHLSDGRRAVVMSMEAADPYRPIVKPLDEQGVLACDALRLRDPDAPTIVHAAGERVSLASA